MLCTVATWTRRKEKGNRPGEIWIRARRYNVNAVRSGPPARSHQPAAQARARVFVMQITHVPKTRRRAMMAMVLGTALAALGPSSRAADDVSPRAVNDISRYCT